MFNREAGKLTLTINMAVVKLLGYISIISLNGRDTKSILEWAERSIGSEEIKNESLSRFASNTRKKQEQAIFNNGNFILSMLHRNISIILQQSSATKV